MAGILDFLQSPDAQLGIGLLAASGPTTDPNQTGFGQRLQGVMRGMDAQKQQDLRLKLLQSQVDENTSQDLLRKAQLARQSRQDAYFLGGMGAAPAPGMGAVASPGDAPGSAPAPGVAAVPGAALGATADTPAPQGKFAEWSKQYGIPVDALVSDYINNAGKGIAEMLMKRGTPDMQVSNGYAYDKNRIGAGYLPQLNMSQDGKASMVQIGPDGLPVVSAPRGAIGTFNDYENAKNRNQALYAPGKGTIGASGRPEPTSVGEDLGVGSVRAPLGVRNNNPGNLRPAGTSTGFQQFETPEAGLTALDQNLQAYGKRGINTIEGVINRWAPSSENNTSSYVKSVSQRLGIPANQPIDLNSPYVRQALSTAIMLQENGPSILTRGPQAGSAKPAPEGTGIGVAGGTDFSPMEKAAQEAEATRLKNTAAADVVRDTTKIADNKRFGQIMATTNRALDLLKQGPTASGFGAMVDSGANFVGKSTKGADLASQLDTLSGWMTANVPRMEGPQSDKDVSQYRIMAAAVGDRTKPVAQRLAAAQELQGLQQKYAELNGIKSSGGASGDWSQEQPKSNTIQELPKTASMGARVRDTSTGKILRFNGLQWKEE